MNLQDIRQIQMSQGNKQNNLVGVKLCKLRDII